MRFRAEAYAGRLPVFFVGLLLCMASVWRPAEAAPDLVRWRAEAERVRQLAENDVPRAHAAALQLQAELGHAPPEPSRASERRPSARGGRKVSAKGGASPRAAKKRPRSGSRVRG